ncbi:hypothetical protein [Paenibacillus flagellatus]|uniref:Uncharacterized protein n=1 Tax=Paenibacillus flagellatus TaxID=2211139 RepID=A0A2V5KBS2_9BACL|nr:hypothetical protein [Paenibacillus flagellatus]PYI57011.1 hypothetical protein DLM86_00755 [Paenibacillus flagellatus]
MPYNAKTNWQYGETVTEADANRWEQGIKDAHTQIDPGADIPVTIPQGVSIVNAERTSRFKELRTTGRTLVNYLGRDGNFEITTRWAGYATEGTASVTPDSSKVLGTQSLTIQGSLTNSVAILHRLAPAVLDTSKFYLFSGYVRSDHRAGIAIGTTPGNASGGASTGLVAGDVTKWRMMYVTFKPTATTLYAFGLVEGTATEAPLAGFDAFQLYEITAAEKTYIDGLSASDAQKYIAAKYPYVDDMKSVNAVYAMNPGKNLFPPSSECTGFSGSNWTVVEPYKVTDTKSSSDYDIYGFYATVVPGQTYTVSVDISSVNGVGSGGGYLDISLVPDDGGMQFGASSPGTLNGVQTLTYAIPANIKKIRVALVVHGNTTGTFTFSNFRMNVGSSALPFEPQKLSYLFLPDCQLRSNVDGSVADVLEGKTITRRFREMTLDGSLVWGLGSNGTGFKMVAATVNGGVTNSEVVLKYDGKPLKNSNGSYTAADQSTLYSPANTISITVSATDSGWGDNYTNVTPEEIKAYFMGWKMYQLEGGVDSVYNGSGTKAWLPQYEYIRHNGSYPGFTTTLPTQPAPNNTGIKNWESYRLQYQLAQSVTETVNYEGELLLHDGPNQIELGTGIVVREAAKPYATGTNNQVNNTNYPSSLFKYRANTIYRFYKGGVDDTGKWTRDTTVANGKVRAYADNANFDPTAAYSVTYFALDTFALGIAPASITGVVTANIRETVDDAVEAITGLRRDVSVLQTQKAGKQQPGYITPGLLNGWSSGADAAGYTKNDQNEVSLVGVISGGVTANDTVILILPPGYRPSKNRRFPIANYDSGAANSYPAFATVRASGNVEIFRVGSNNALDLSNIKFRAEQ